MEALDLHLPGFRCGQRFVWGNSAGKEVLAGKVGSAGLLEHGIEYDVSGCLNPKCSVQVLSFGIAQEMMILVVLQTEFYRSVADSCIKTSPAHIEQLTNCFKSLCIFLFKLAPDLFKALDRPL